MHFDKLFARLIRSAFYNTNRKEEEKNILTLFYYRIFEVYPTALQAKRKRGGQRRRREERGEERRNEESTGEERRGRREREWKARDIVYEVKE